MKIIVEENYEKMSNRAALLLASQIHLKENSKLGLATGGTPMGMYNKLIEMYNEDEVDFSQVMTFNLDEYCGLSKENPNSYHYYMFDNFFNHINIKKENVNIPDGMTEDYNKECREYESLIENAGGIDLQVLGIGANGHIGFNEPAEKLNVMTNVVNLSKETIQANSRYFENEEKVPKQAISMGMATILKSKRILLLASGKNKVEAIKATVSGKISTGVPASLLQTHPEITLIIDKEAAALISEDNISANCELEIKY
ncbi:glucosamine-6-phosphate deaminase [Halanaerobium sp. Z-7514]|uniref:Glucosamine-6-phosphate deaminase n=1 Tax=Halanaerobium polyolivorans TaxID=2886943 RepID=A0AAW4X2G7_9FIRM|nr:glucosamine-6-phosphate deaminase [Halanaerobium polyolivorans]MCC3146010.1 glucosamine-6-phosphate deaminase [Halanaerobium polyolivorans]RQD78774.1 MAG: glucosamine-6-phosphate deaminase [Halanaerobium sp. MSAO_Bac5]